MDEGSRWDNPVTGVFVASEDVLRRILDLADLFRTAGGGALGALGTTPVPAAVTGLLSSLVRLVEQAPAPVEQLEMLLQEIGAKRALIGALNAQMDAFDRELAILERSLQPLRDWGHQWSQVQSSLIDSLRVLRVPGMPTGRDKPDGGGEE